MKNYNSKRRWLLRFFAVGLFALTPLDCLRAAETNSGSGIGLKLLAEGLGAPETLVSIPDGSGRLLLAEQAGTVQLLDRDGKKSGQPFLDLREKIVPLGQGMEERGLLGFALHPQFKVNHRFYVVLLRAATRARPRPMGSH